MSPELIKIFAPVIAFLAWMFFVNKQKYKVIKGVSLYFLSYAVFSSNFSFFYREIHQVIQILLIVLFLFATTRSRRVQEINIVFLVFLLFVGVSLVFSGINEDAKSQLINLLVSFSVCNYLFVATNNSKNLDRALEFFAGLSVFVALTGFLEFFVNGNSRIEGTLSNSNYYGFFIGIGFCLVFVKWQGWRRNVALCFILIAIILSGSRSALLLPLLQYLWFSYRTGNIKKLIPYVLLLSVAVAVIAGSGISRFSNTEETASSDAERIIFAGIALSMANDNPFTGVGWGRFISEFGKYSSTSQVIALDEGDIDASTQDRRVTHNDFLRILAELGWVAFLATVGFLLYGFYIVLNKKYLNSDCLTPIWFGMILFSASHNNLNNALFWFFILLPYYIYGKECYKKNRHRRKLF